MAPASIQGNSMKEEICPTCGNMYQPQPPEPKKHIHKWRVAYTSTTRSGQNKTTTLHCVEPNCSVPLGAFKEVEGHLNVEHRIPGLGDRSTRIRRAK